MEDRSYRGAETTGFQSPAQDYIEGPIKWSEILNMERPGMYPVRAGRSLNFKGIYEGDILIADASAEPAVGKVAIAFVQGQTYLAELGKRDGAWVLLRDDQESEPIRMDDEGEIWGIVASLVRDKV